MHYAESPYGFEYGAAKVERLFSDEKKGWVTIGVTTPKVEIQVYVTKTGKVRVFSKGHRAALEEKIGKPNKQLTTAAGVN